MSINTKSNPTAIAKNIANKIKKRPKKQKAEAPKSAIVSAWERELSQLDQTGLNAAIKKLWRSFNKNRDTLTRDYMSSQTAAYFASFYLPNVFKIQTILRQKRILQSLEKHMPNWGQTWHIVDFGAGPLTASAAFLESFLNSVKKLPKKIIITAIEPSSVSVQLGERVLKSIVHKKIDLKVEHLRDYKDVTGTPHLVLVANSLNEMPAKLGNSAIHLFLKLLDRQGHLIIVEPGQDTHSKALSGMRDNLLSDLKKQSRSILGPCLHHKICPLGPNANRPNDWCWFQKQWSVPEQQLQFDKRSGIDHSEINFSYLAIGPEAERLVTHYARVVSDAFWTEPTKATQTFWKANLIQNQQNSFNDIGNTEKVAKQLLCTKDGKLTAQISGQQFKTRRGETVDDKKILIEVEERF